MEELKGAQEIRIDEYSRFELKESHSTIQELASQMQELARRMEFPRRDSNRRRRTREGPEPACVQTPFVFGGGTRREGRGN